MEYEFNEKRIDLLNKKVDILYKIILIFIVGIITLNMNKYYFEENIKIQFDNKIQKETTLKLKSEQKYLNKEDVQINELELLSKELEKLLSEEIENNKKLRDYFKDFLEIQVYFTLFLILFLVRYYIQIVLIGHKNELIIKSILEIESIYCYKNKKN